MSTPLYEPLRVAPPVTNNHVRMAWALRAREAARKALDAALAVPRRAADYVTRAVRALRLAGAVSWLRRALGRAARPLTAISSRLGRPGLVAGAVAAVTSPTGRSLLGTVVRLASKGLSWTARTAYSGLDRVLRCFGRTGNAAADKLFTSVVSLSGKAAAVTAPAVHRMARLSDPETPQARVVSALCRSYLLHRLLKGFVGNVWLRLLVEAVLIPAVVDSRIAVWARGVLQDAPTRAQRLQEQAQVVVDLQRQDAAQTGQLPLPTELQDLPVAAGAESLTTPSSNTPVPANRAERRAAQRKRT